jgi:NAD(P)-dependent dehydrogenase (short-subunit alcohol dehydrogenase family)
MELVGRVSFVTGAARGIGREIAARLAREGSQVFAADLDQAGAEATARTIIAAGGRAVPVHVDVADASSVSRAFAIVRDHATTVDTLVNVAGIWAGGSVTEISIEDWDRTMSVNTRGVFLCSRAVLPDMVERRRGVIINIASTAAFKGTARAGAYNASKAAVIGITRNIAIDYAPYGIRALALCPGLVETDMELQLRTFRGDTDEYRKLALKAHPLGRLGTPADIADAAVFLASERASWMTGSSLTVDGGTLA